MQPGFFDQDDRLAKLDKLSDPLPRLDSIVDWKALRPLKVIHQKQRKSKAGRKPHEVTLMFKMLVLQALYNLSDDQTEFQVLFDHDASSLTSHCMISGSTRRNPRVSRKTGVSGSPAC